MSGEGEGTVVVPGLTWVTGDPTSYNGAVRKDNDLYLDGVWHGQITGMNIAWSAAPDGSSRSHIEIRYRR